MWGRVSRYSSISGLELIRACAQDNNSAPWNEFVSRFQRPISLSVIRVAYQWGEAPQQILDDLVQETYLKLCADNCRLLLEFATLHPEAILGYVKTIALNATHDHFKSQHSQKRGSGEVRQILEDEDAISESSGLGGQAAIEREVLIRQINQCLDGCSQGPDRERDCTIFWLYYQQGMSAKDIANLPAIGLSAKGVESALFRLTRLVREQLVGLHSRAGSTSITGKGFLSAESY